MKKGQDIAVRFPGLFLVHHNLPGKKVERHSHSKDHLLFIPLQGEIRVLLNNKKLTAGPGKMIYLPKGVSHSFDSSDMQGERLIALIQDKEWQALKLGVYPPSLLSTSQLMKEIFFYLLLNSKTKSAKSLVATLCSTLAEALEATGEGVEWEHLESRSSDPHLKRALVFLSENYAESFPMNRVAKEAGVSDRSLNRLFSIELGLSPKQVLALYRISIAKTLLLKGDKSVTEVAFEVGYGSLTQFISMFRKLTGQLPSEVARFGLRLGEK